MPLKPAVLISAAVLATAALGACSPVTKVQGYTVIDTTPADTVVGTDTRTTVQTKYGSPTTVASFDPNVWYYMGQVTDRFGAYRTRVRSRAIVEITFDKTSGQVKDVKTFNAENGREIAYSTRETPTIGRELGILEQILGNIGQSMLPQQEIDPGNLPGRGGAN